MFSGNVAFVTCLRKMLVSCARSTYLLLETRAAAASLIEILRRGDIAEDEQTTIYVARPWSPDADAIVVSPAPAATDPVEQNGQTVYYFLERVPAQEFFEDLVASGEFERASERQLCERLIRYAEADA